MGDLFGVAANLPYAARVAVLQKAGIAVWDVLQSCVRPGSLDAAIESDSIIPNDLAAFFKKHEDVQKIFFNGQTAARIFAKRILPALPAQILAIDRKTLPSTSPAHAALPFAQKLEIWRQGIFS